MGSQDHTRVSPHPAACSSQLAISESQVQPPRSENLIGLHTSSAQYCREGSHDANMGQNPAPEPKLGEFPSKRDDPKAQVRKALENESRWRVSGRQMDLSGSQWCPGQFQGL